MVLIKTGGVSTADIPTDAIDTAELQTDSITNEKILAANVTQGKNANGVIIRCTLTLQQNGTNQTGAIGYMPFLGDVVGITFMNDSGNVYGGVTGAIITGASGAIRQSSNNLADNTSEHFVLGDMANHTNLAKTSTLALTTGTGAGAGPSIAIIEIEGQINEVV